MEFLSKLFRKKSVDIIIEPTSRTIENPECIKILALKAYMNSLLSDNRYIPKSEYRARLLDEKKVVEYFAVLENSGMLGFFCQTNGVDEKEVQETFSCYSHFEELVDTHKASSAIDILHSWGIQGKTIVQLGIGFHDNSFNSFMNYMTKQKSYSIIQLEEAKLVLQSAKGNYCDKMRNSIIIPTIDAKGNVVCFDFYITDKQQLFKYPNTTHFARSQNLYSYNLAIRSNKKSVVIVTTYEDYFKLIGLGITNLVSTYLPKITEEQLELLKQKFKVVILIANQHVNATSCTKYCRENNMYCDQIDLQGCSSVVEYIDKNAQTIIDKVDEYERILT